jgi:hypothetical protein
MNLSSLAYVAVSSLLPHLEQEELTKLQDYVAGRLGGTAAVTALEGAQDAGNVTVTATATAANPEAAIGDVINAVETGAEVGEATASAAATKPNPTNAGDKT